MTIPASLALLKAAFSGKVPTIVAWFFPVFTTVAVTEAFMGQVIIALIAAIPTTLTGIVALIVVLRKQEKIAQALDGKLTELVKAKVEVGKAEGVQQERVEERDRIALAAAVKEPVDVNVVNTEEQPVPTVSKDEKISLAPPHN